MEMIEIYLDGIEYLRVYFSASNFIAYHTANGPNHYRFGIDEFYKLTNDRYHMLLEWYISCEQYRTIIVFLNNEFKEIKTKEEFKEYLFFELLKSN